MRKSLFKKEDHEKEILSLQIRNFVIAYTDGSCWYKDKEGGVGVFLRDGFLEKRLSLGPFVNTTISRMELYAILEALKLADRKRKLIIYSDSEYVVDGINIWCENWDLEHRVNGDLFLEILSILNEFEIHPIIKHIPGHQGIEGNDIADQLAFYARKSKKKDFKKNSKKLVI